jgi:hypothetical protein
MSFKEILRVFEIYHSSVQVIAWATMPSSVNSVQVIARANSNLTSSNSERWTASYHIATVKDEAPLSVIVWHDDSLWVWITAGILCVIVNPFQRLHHFTHKRPLRWIVDSEASSHCWEHWRWCRAHQASWNWSAILSQMNHAVPMHRQTREFTRAASWVIIWAYEVAYRYSVVPSDKEKLANHMIKSYNQIQKGAAYLIKHLAARVSDICESTQTYIK